MFVFTCVTEIKRAADNIAEDYLEKMKRKADHQHRPVAAVL